MAKHSGLLKKFIALFVVIVVCAGVFVGTLMVLRSGKESPPDSSLSELQISGAQASSQVLEVNDFKAPDNSKKDAADIELSTDLETSTEGFTTLGTLSADEARARLDLVEDMRAEFAHGGKSAGFQKYIVLHDTEGDSSPESVVSWWAGNGNLVAAHFVVGKDGHIVQCVPMDQIAHHAGYGDVGHNASFGVEDESRDDKRGTVPIGASFPDYGMNSYSIGIEMVHVGGSGDYPEAQLVAVDNLIAYIDAYYGFESAIIDHKAWRSGNSDTSAEFAGYLANYQNKRMHL